MALVQNHNTNIIDALVCLSHQEVPSVELKRSLQKFVIMLYISKQNELIDRYTFLEDIGLLRWELHSKFWKDSCALPPTPAALKFNLLRANFITVAWKRFISSFNPTLPSLRGTDGIKSLYPWIMMTDEFPAPEFSLELTISNMQMYKKTHCAKNQCLCREHKVITTKVCQVIRKQST